MQHIGTCTHRAYPFTHQKPKRSRYLPTPVFCQTKANKIDNTSQTAQERLEANLKNLSRQEARALSKTTYFVGVVAVLTATAVTKTVNAVACGVQELARKSSSENQSNLTQIVEGAGQKLETYSQKEKQNKDMEKATQQILNSTIASWSLPPVNDTESQSTIKAVVTFQDKIKQDVSDVKSVNESGQETAASEEDLSPREILDQVSYPKAELTFRSMDEISDAFLSLDFMDHVQNSIDTKLEDRVFGDFDFDICDRPVGPYQILKWFEQEDTSLLNVSNAVEETRSTSHKTFDLKEEIDVSNLKWVGEKTQEQSQEIDISKLEWVGEANQVEATQSSTYVQSSCFDGTTPSKIVESSEPEIVPELSTRPVPVRVVKMQYYQVGDKQREVDKCISKIKIEISNGSVPIENASQSMKKSDVKPQKVIVDTSLTSKTDDDKMQSMSNIKNGIDSQKGKRHAYLKKLEEDVGDASWLLPLVSVYVLLIPQFEILQSQVQSKKQKVGLDRAVVGPKL